MNVFVLRPNYCTVVHVYCGYMQSIGNSPSEQKEGWWVEKDRLVVIKDLKICNKNLNHVFCLGYMPVS